MELLHAIPKSWKNDLSDVKNIHNLIFQDHHLLRKHHMYFLNRLSSKEIDNFLTAQKEEQTSSRLYITRSSTIAILTGKIYTYW